MNSWRRSWLVAAVALLFCGNASASACDAVFADGFEEAGTAPPFVVLEAVATSATSVSVCFNRAVDPGTLDASGSQFVFDNDLTPLSPVSADTNGREVIVGTTTQIADNQYVVTVAASLKDDFFGIGPTPGQNQAQFRGFVP